MKRLVLGLIIRAVLIAGPLLVALQADAETTAINNPADAESFLKDISIGNFDKWIRERATDEDGDVDAMKAWRDYRSQLDSARRYATPGDPRLAKAYALLALHEADGRQYDLAARDAQTAEDVANANPAANAEALGDVDFANCFIAAGYFGAALQHGRVSSELVTSLNDVCMKARASATPDQKVAIDQLLQMLKGEGQYADQASPGIPYIDFEKAQKADRANDMAAVASILSGSDTSADNMLAQARASGQIGGGLMAMVVPRWKIFGLANRAWLADVLAGEGDAHAAEVLNRVEAAYEDARSYIASAAPYDRSILLYGLAHAHHAAFVLNRAEDQEKYKAAFDDIAARHGLADVDSGLMITAFKLMSDVAYGRTAPGNYQAAYPYAKQAYDLSAASLEGFFTVSGSGSDGYNSADQERSIYAPYIWAYVNAAIVTNHDPETVFEAAQWLRSTQAGTALREAALSLAADTPELKAAITQRKALAAELDGLTGRAATSSDESIDLEDKREKLQAQLKDLDASISRMFPRYRTLLSPHPVSLASVQALLANDEALVMYFQEMGALAMMAVTKTAVRAHWANAAAQDIEKDVRILRNDLVLEDGRAAREFHLDVSYRVYRNVFEPAEANLAGIHRLLIVPDGPLESLPLSVLVDHPPASGDAYAGAHWLNDRFSMAYLPDVPSLALLRAPNGPHPQGAAPFIGFGNPTLGPPFKRQSALESPVAFTAGGIAPSPDALRRLPSLPETVDELQRVAANLQSGEGSVFVGPSDTETTLKDLSDKGVLAQRRILMFATHGLLAAPSNAQNILEPGLVFTPPDRPTLRDDGYLTASEAAELNLHADLVVLSACNTALGDGTPAGRPLSGLARGFFLAGARAVLASHWAVDSGATRNLMQRAIANDNPDGRSVALQTAMAAMAHDPAGTYSHPAFWAPFVLVGDGR